MCGIAGYIGKKIIKDSTLKNTINLMHTRGPDASDYKIFKSSNDLNLEINGLVFFSLKSLFAKNDEDAFR